MVDIVRFLNTLERSFKTLTYSNDFVAIKDCTGGIMKGLKLVWCVSRYFNTPERMTRIIARCAWQLKERVKILIDIKNSNLSNEALVDLADRVSEAKSACNDWTKSFAAVKHSLENESKAPRWDFDRSKTCYLVEHVGKVCTDIHEVISVSDKNRTDQSMKFI